MALKCGCLHGTLSQNGTKSLHTSLPTPSFPPVLLEGKRDIFFPVFIVEVCLLGTFASPSRKKEEESVWAFNSRGYSLCSLRHGGVLVPGT